MSKERMEEIQNEVNYAYRRNGSINTKAVTMPIEHYGHLYEQAERFEKMKQEFSEDIDFKRRKVLGLTERVQELEEQNKRYREAREIIEQVYKENYTRNAYGYEDGYLDGLDTAMSIIDEALEESE